jgi:hypothetical protein
MGPAVPWPMNDFTANHQPVISSMRALYMKKKKVTVKHNTPWLLVRKPQQA